MIKVTVEVWRYGDSLDKKVLGEAFIINDGTGAFTRGNYKYIIWSKGKHFREGKIKGFERKRKNVWWLLYYIMKDAIWEQQGEKGV